MAAVSTTQLTQAKSFWRILRSVSVGEVQAEATRGLAVALVGEPERREYILSRLYPNTPGDRIYPALRVFDSTSEDDGFPLEPGSFDIVIDAGGGRAEAPVPAPIYSPDDVGGWDRCVRRILDENPDGKLALARRFPGLRPTVCNDIIHETCVANAQLAMLNALPGVLPALSMLLPTALVGDIVLLTKNQAMMLLRLAAAYELPLDLRARSLDAAPLLGNAFGWRAVARELVGVVPGGVGVVARGMIAYCGTYAVGKGLEQLYALGQQPTRAQLRGLFQEAIGQARSTVGRIGRRGAPIPKRLPPQ